MITTNLTAGLSAYYEKEFFKQAYGDGWEYEWDYYHSAEYGRLVKRASALSPGLRLGDKRTKAHRYMKAEGPNVRRAYERKHPKPPQKKLERGGGKTITFTRYTPL